MDTIVYEIEGSLYINLTNKCSNNCDFCIRNHRDGMVDYNLWLSKTPTAKEIIEELKNQHFEQFNEIVFCGYGEPLYALDAMLEVAKFVKGYGLKTRVNTNGQADLICGQGVAKKFDGLIDIVNISLNEASREKYQKVCHCAFGEKGYDALLKFAGEVKQYSKVIFSIVDTIPKEDIEKCKQIAEDIGVTLRIREYIK